MPSNRSTHGFAAADDEERWIAVEPGIPIARLILGEAVDVGGPAHLPTLIKRGVDATLAPLTDQVEVFYVNRIFEGAPGKVRPDLVDLDERIEKCSLDEASFAKLLARRMGWEERGSRARLIMARCRQGQPILDSEYAAVQRILGVLEAVDRLPFIRLGASK